MQFIELCESLIKSIHFRNKEEYTAMVIKAIYLAVQIAAVAMYFENGEKHKDLKAVVNLLSASKSHAIDEFVDLLKRYIRITGTKQQQA